MSAVVALLDSLPRTSLVVGKGGVGKTTCAAGIAALFARRGEETLLLSTDPAAALANVIGSPVASDAAPVPTWPHLSVRQLAAADLRRDFLGRWRDTIAEIVDRGTYLDRSDIDGIVDAALPGADEIFALLAFADILADRSARYARIVVDTAPTGHTLRLLAMPDTFSALVSMLDAMQEKHRFMVRALTRRYKSDRADEFIAEMRSRIDALRAALADARAVAAVVVTRDESVVRAETVRYVEQLAALHIRVAGIIVNATSSSAPARAVADAAVPQVEIAEQPQPPVGLEAIVRAFSSPRGQILSSRAQRGISSRGERSLATLGMTTRALTIVGGKGGVGKSTVACALSIAAVDADGQRTLLVSTDPAPSIADALGETGAAWTREDTEHEVDDPRGLVVRQMDATAAFARMREQYQSRIDALFDALVGRGSGESRGVGVDLDRDKAIIRDLLSLAPPGIDELYALSILGDALHEGRFTRIVVDPAPTGHLLRLLDMPAIALDWTHRLMRLMLQYRDIVGLGETAQELLDFAKRTRALDALLHDATRCGLVLVSLDEPVVRAETERLATEVSAREIAVSAVVWNRTRTTTGDFFSPLPATRDTRQLFAPEVTPPPIGAAALREWSHHWYVTTPDS